MVEDLHIPCVFVQYYSKVLQCYTHIIIALRLFTLVASIKLL